MGQWTLESVNGMSNPLDGETFGTNFHAHFKLRYKPAVMDSFAELPRLDWHEKIIMKEHHKSEWWEFETNMYTHNPLSKTLEIWAKRYIEAYKGAAGIPAICKGGSQLLDKNGQKVTADKLGKNLTKPDEQANAVRSYLKKNGGILLLHVHDIPSINPPTGTDHKERLLLFDCGLEGSALRLKAMQYLDVDGSKPKGQWLRQLSMSWSRTQLDAAGFNKVAAPAGVSAPRQALFTSGECW